MKKILLTLLFLATVISAYSQTSEEMLEMMVANKLLTRAQADSLKLSEEKKHKNSFLIETARQMQLSGYTQVRFQILEAKNINDGFDIRRARLDLRGNVTPRFAYRLQTDLSVSPKILDAFGQIKITDYLNITFGQFTIPFSLENNTSNNRFDVIEYAMAVDALCARGKDVIGNHNGRDIGIQAGGILLKNEAGTILEYRLGIFNGTGINVSDTANGAKDISGRLILNPLKGLSLGVSYYDGWGKAIKPTTEYVGKSQERDRFGFEMAYVTSRISFKAEYIHGRDGNIKRSGWYAMAGYYIIPKKLQAVFKYDTFDPSTGISNNILTNYIAGINLDFNTWSRLQAFYTIREEDGPKTDNNLFAVQYQIGF